MKLLHSLFGFAACASLALATEIAVPSVSLRIARPGAAPPPPGSLASVNLAFPKTTSDDLVALPRDKIVVSLQIVGAAANKPFRAQHVVLALSNSAIPSSAASFAMTPTDTSSYNVVIDLATDAALVKLSQPSGIHDITIYISDAKAKPFKYPLGTMRIDTTGAGSKPRLEVGDVFEPQHEIVHVMRPAEKLPPVTLSMTFTGFTLTPWVFLVFGWALLGANINNLFASTANLVYGISFTASLIAFAGLFYVYWIGMTVFELLGYGFILSCVSALLGRQALVARVALRTKMSK